MKASLLLLAVLFLSCEKQSVEPLRELSGTTWHWFEFRRDMNNKPVNHYLEFNKSNIVHYRAEQAGILVNQYAGTYELLPERVVLTFGRVSDTLNYTGDKIIVKKSSESLEFYMQVK